MNRYKLNSGTVRKDTPLRSAANHLAYALPLLSSDDKPNKEKEKEKRAKRDKSQKPKKKKDKKDRKKKKRKKSEMAGYMDGEDDDCIYITSKKKMKSNAGKPTVLRRSKDRETRFTVQTPIR